MRQSIFLLAILCLICSTAFAATPLKPERAIEKQVAPTPVLQPDGSRLDLLFESFEDGVPPADWSIMTSGESYGWDGATGEANSGAASAWVQYGAQGTWQDEWLVTPALDASALAGMFLQFYEYEVYWADWGYKHSVLVSTTVPDDPGAFTEIVAWTPGDHTVAGWGVPVEVNLSAFAGSGSVYVAFRYEGEYADDWYIDDVWVYEPSEHDVRAQSLEPSGQILLAGEPVPPVFTVKNIGLNTETFLVDVIIDDGSGIIYDEFLTVTDLPSGETMAVEFPPFVPESGNLYTLTGTAVLDGDQEPGNNSLTVVNECFSAPRTPMALLVTNWDCGPCAPANSALDAWYPGENGQSALVRVHCWWPGPDDPMYLANIEQADFLIWGTPTGADFAPHLWVDNNIDAGSDAGSMVGFIDAAKDIAAPLLVTAQYDQGGSNALVNIEVMDPLNPDGEYVLFVAVTEDNIEAAGTNGEPIHNQAFRWLYPGIEGLAIDTVQGQYLYTVAMPLEPGWVYDELSMVAWVQDLTTGRVQNAFTMMLNEGSVAIDPPAEQDETPALETRLFGAHPNPFNPLTSVKFSLAIAEQVRLDVYDVEGRRVSQIANGLFAAGEHSVRWNGQDENGRDLPSGTYMVQMVTENAIRASKMTLVR